MNDQFPEIDEIDALLADKSEVLPKEMTERQKSTEVSMKPKCTLEQEKQRTGTLFIDFLKEKDITYDKSTVKNEQLNEYLR